MTGTSIDAIEKLTRSTALDKSSIVGATVVTTRAVHDENLMDLDAYLVIDVYSSDCEIRKVTGRNDRDYTLASALSNAHEAGAPVLVLDSLEVNVKYFGAVGDDVADDSTAIQAAIDAADGSPLVLPAGDYAIASSLLIPAAGMNLSAYGVTITYSGSDYAIKHDATFTSTYNSLNMSGFTLKGNANALGGLNLDAPSSSYSGALRDIVIQDFTKSGAYALRLGKHYHRLMSNVTLWNNYHGVLIGEEAIACKLDNCWIEKFTGYGVHIDATNSQGTSMVGGIIQSSGQTPATQIGLYLEDGAFAVRDVIFESLYQHWKADAGELLIDGAWVNSGPTAASAMTAGVDAHFVNIQSVSGHTLTAALGTTWENSRLLVTPPTVTGRTITNPSTVMIVDFAAPGNLSGMDSTGNQKCDWITLVFASDNVTVKHEDSGYLQGTLSLRAGADVTPAIGDSMTFRRTGSTYQWREVGDFVAQSEITDELTTVTHSAPGTPDYAIADPIQPAGFGFTTQDEALTVLSVIANLQARVNELETTLVTHGLLADAD